MKNDGKNSGIINKLNNHSSPPLWGTKCMCTCVMQPPDNCAGV